MSKRKKNKDVAPSHPDCERCKKQKRNYEKTGKLRMKAYRNSAAYFIRRKLNR